VILDDKPIQEEDMSIEQHFSKLGKRAKDVVTGAEGVIETISFDLYGCIQVILKPPVDKDGKIQDGRWCDISRIVIIDDEPVMPVPDFNSGGPVAEGKKGPADKPVP